ncbi:hypothetical protein AOB60_01670 [Streptomyces noursei]|uniref:Uncharacterized protein n=1 Tax=Streptomyces noursei TaxID=1971 RepID=A0A2N8PFS1_STRNR|nr:hypothetical protein AOB60_01670 [Streptomyces noursei]
MACHDASVAQTADGELRVVRQLLALPGGAFLVPVQTPLVQVHLEEYGAHLGLFLRDDRQVALPEGRRGLVAIPCNDGDVGVGANAQTLVAEIACAAGVFGKTLQ